MIFVPRTVAVMSGSASNETTTTDEMSSTTSGNMSTTSMSDTTSQTAGMGCAAKVVGPLLGLQMLVAACLRFEHFCRVLN